MATLTVHLTLPDHLALRDAPTVCANFLDRVNLWLHFSPNSAWLTRCYNPGGLRGVIAEVYIHGPHPQGLDRVLSSLIISMWASATAGSTEHQPFTEDQVTVNITLREYRTLIQGASEGASS